MGRVKDRLIARREERAQLGAVDDLVRDDGSMPWDAVLSTLPLHAQPGSMLRGLPARTEFRDEGEV